MRLKRMLSAFLAASCLMSGTAIPAVFAETAETPAYSEDFSGFTADKAQIEKYELYNGIKTIAEKNGAKWTTSGLWVGNNASSPTDKCGYTYVDAQNGGLVLAGRYGDQIGTDRYAAVNLDITDKRIDKIERVTANYSANWAKMAAVRILVSEDEQSFVEIGSKRDGNIGVKSQNIKGDEDALLPQNQPYIRAGTGKTGYETDILAVPGVNGTLTENPQLSENDTKWDNAQKLTWDISFDYVGGKINYICTDDKKGTVWQGSIDDTFGLLEKQWRYPAAFAATGNSDTNPAKLHSLNIWYTEDTEYIAPSFADDFSDYGETDGTVTEKYSLYNGRKTLAKNGVWEWETSNVWVGNSADSPTANKGFAYVDTSNDRMHLQGRWGSAIGESRYAAINLDGGSRVKVDGINKIHAIITRNATRMSSIRLFVSDSEKKFYEFGAKNNEQIGINFSGANNDELNNFQPFVRYGTDSGMYNNTMENLLKVGDEGTETNGIEWTYNNGALLDWEITVDNVNKQISFICTNLSTNAVWSGSFDDTCGLIDSEWRYPVAFAATGDGENSPAYLKKFEMWCDIDQSYTAPDFAEDFTEFNSKQEGSLKLNDLALSGNTTLAERADGVKLVTSKVHMGLAGNDIRGAVNLQDKKLYLLGYGDIYNSQINVNFDDTDTYFNSLERAQFTASRGGTRTAGMRFFVSGDEKTAIEIGIKGNQQIFRGEDIPNYVPYVSKSVGGQNTVIAYAPDDGTWTSGDDTVDFDITVSGNTVSWTAKSKAGKVWTGSYEDTDNIISADWRYPCSFIARGDTRDDNPLNAAYFTKLNLWYSTRAARNYDDGEWTEKELLEKFDELKYASRPSEIHNLLSKKFAKAGSAAANITINDSISAPMEEKNLAVQCEFSDSYDFFFDSDGNIKDEIREYLADAAPVSHWRWGGGTSNRVNLLNTITPYDGSARPQSTYLAAEYLPNTYKSVAGQTASAPYKMGVAEYVKVQQLINPASAFTPCISMYTMTTDDVVEFLKFMTSTDYKYKTWRENVGLSGEALKLDYVELGNEVDIHLLNKIDGKVLEEEVETPEQRIEWYMSRAKAYEQAIHNYDPNIKVIACGPTGAWGNIEQSELWMQKLGETFGNSLYGVAYHPYYYGHKPAFIIDQLPAQLKASYDNAAGTDIKIVATEHARAWGAELDRSITSGMLANTQTAYSLLHMAKQDLFGGAYYHSWAGTTYLWQYYTRIDGKLLRSGTDKMYGVLSGAFSGERLDTTVTLSENEDKIVNEFDALAVRKNSRETDIILVNQEGYYDVNASIGIGGEYYLANETVYTAPNIITFAYDSETSDKMTVTSREYTEKTPFSSYTVPENSVVVLKLKRISDDAELQEKFDGLTEFEVDGDKVWNEETQEFMRNSNETYWTVVPDKSGEYMNGTKYGYGRITAKNGVMTLTSGSGASEFAANWNVGAVIGTDAAVKEISFKTTGGGVRLFTDAAGNSEYDFNGSKEGLSGTVTWKITVSGNQLSWSATNGTAAKSGTMDYSDKSCEYILSAYLPNGGSMNISGISVIYTEGGITHGITVDGTKITVVPSAYDEENMCIIASFYDGGKLIDVKTKAVDMSRDKDEFTPAPPSGYSKMKVMLWKSLTGGEPVDSVH